MSTSNEESGPVAALMIPTINKYLITFAWAVHDHLENNQAFPNPSAASAPPSPPPPRAQHLARPRPGRRLLLAPALVAPR